MSQSPQSIPIVAPQYRLWHLLVATTLVAIVVAAAAPWLRPLTIEKWRQLGLWAMGFVAGSAGLSAGAYFLHRGAMRRIRLVEVQEPLSLKSSSRALGPSKLPSWPARPRHL